MECRHHWMHEEALRRAPRVPSFFASGAHRLAIAAVGRGLAQGCGLVAIIGDPGSGKSMLAAHLRASLDRRRIEVAQLDPHVSIQSAGGEPLDLRGPGPGRGLLLIDDAHTVAPARLAGIARQAFAAAAPWLVVVLARTEFEQALSRLEAASGLAPGRAVRHRLAPLSAADARAFLRQLAGEHDRPDLALSDAPCMAIHAASEGNPAAFVRLASRAFARLDEESCGRAAGEFPSAASFVVAGSSPIWLERLTSSEVGAGELTTSW